jgi:hypothetical protein
MAAHLRPRVQTITNRKGRSDSGLQKLAAGKCSGLLGSNPLLTTVIRDDKVR